MPDILEQRISCRAAQYIEIIANVYIPTACNDWGHEQKARRKSLIALGWITFVNLIRISVYIYI